MGAVLQVATLLGTAVALLAFFSEYKTRFRRAIRESLELSTLFTHDEELSHRFRARADALAEEYLSEVEKSDHPASVNMAAGLAGLAAVVLTVRWWGLEEALSPAEEFAANVVAGLIAAVAGLMLRDPVAWLSGRARSLHARYITQRAAGAQRQADSR